MSDDKMEVTLLVSKQLLWETLGSGWENGYAWVGIKYLGDADWNKIGRFEMSYLDAEGDEGDEEVLTKEMGIEDLARGYKLAVENDFHHCGSALSLDNQDFCSADAILQYAIYGDLIYG